MQAQRLAAWRPLPGILVLSALCLVVLEQVLTGDALLAVPRTRLLLAVALLGFAWNFGIPLAYFLWQSRRAPGCFAGLRTVTSYASGLVGDGVVVPMLDVGLVALFREVGPLTPDLAWAALAGGVVVTAGLHVTQARLGLCNWSMPEPGKWSVPGQWHLVSAPAQFGAVGAGMLLAATHAPRLIADGSWLPLLLLALGQAFLGTVLFDYRAEIALGRSGATSVVGPE